MLKSSPPVPVNVTLFGDRIIADVIKIRSLGWGLESHMTSDFIRREEAQRQTHREKPCDNRVRDRSSAHRSQGTPRIASNTQGSEKGMEQILPYTFRGRLDLLAPGFWISSFQNSGQINFCCGNVLCQPWEIKTWGKGDLETCPSPGVPSHIRAVNHTLEWKALKLLGSLPSKCSHHWGVALQIRMTFHLASGPAVQSTEPSTK